MNIAADVHAELVQLERAEAARKQRMNAALQRASAALEHTCVDVGERMTPPLDAAYARARVLERRFETTASSAQQLHHDLNVLYEERKRIDYAMDWCLEAIQLRTALGALDEALQRLDWDACIKHCQEASTVSREVLESEFARIVVPTAMHPDAPTQLLAHLRQTLLERITQQFEHFTAERNEEQATRFLSYFAAIGAHDVGLAAYSKFACALVHAYGKELEEKARAPSTSSPQFFGTLWTALFEYLAVFINKHQPVVDRLLYAPGHNNFEQSVLPSLEREWTRLALCILDTWRGERVVDKLIRDARGEKFAALDAIRAAPYTPGRIFGQEDRSALPPAAFAASSAAATAASMPSDYIHVDPFLNEMVTFSAQWSLFAQFLQRIKRKSGVFADAQLGNSVDGIMRSVYLPLQMYALRASVQQVHKLDTPDLQAQPYASSLPDDMFFALRAVLTRALSTSSLQIAEHVVSEAVTMVEADYLEIVVLRMDGCRRALNIARLVDGPRRAAAAREVRTTLCVYLNVLDVSAAYSDRILADLSSRAFLESYFAADADDERSSPLADAQGIVNALGALAPKLRTALQFEMDELFRTLIEPRLSGLVSDILREMQYRLDEAAYARIQEGPALADRVRSAWDMLVVGYRDQLTEPNYALLFSMAIDALIRPWEQVIPQLAFTELGALQFDKDLRGVLSKLGELAPWGIRDKFLQLQQMSYILNMDEDETDTSDAYEAGVSAGISWQMTPAEVQQIRALRVHITS